MNTNLLFLFILSCPIIRQTFSTTPSTPTTGKIKHLAFLYSMLFDTFDPREVEPGFLTSDENQAEINEFSDAVHSIINHMEYDDDIVTISRFERYEIFWDAVDQIQYNRDFDAKPISFQLFKTLNEKSLTRDEYCTERDRFLQMAEDQIKEAIEKIDLNNIDRTKTKQYKAFPNQLFKHQYTVNGKSLTIHHIISRNVINKFRIYSDAILANYRKEMNKKFDYYRIRDHNRRKLMLPNFKYIYEKYGISSSDNTNLNEDDKFKNFMRQMDLVPNGLTFLGPDPKERSDDPGQIRKIASLKKEYIRRYGEYDEDFEYSCEAIVGPNYFKRVLNLYKKIKKYNEKASERTLEKTFELNNELDTIHFYREDKIGPDGVQYPWFAWYPNSEWNYDRLEIGAPAHRVNIIERPWNVKTEAEMDRPSDRPGTSGYRSLPTTQSTSTTTIKTTTEDLLPQLLDGLQIDDRFSAFGAGSGAAKYFRDELRKKRQNYHHFECPSNEIEVTTPKPNGFWCSPFYLRINPMNYFYCKLTGHQNLHFF